ncbi:hypothetical protein ABZV60_12460 [Streptomyces sp. NPDC004787]|uniref:hypothetical protein n=1 Tax=Streptomyces sp. NPDC004787 TaxID=3154291 RepID=UPI0033A32F63
MPINDQPQGSHMYVLTLATRQGQGTASGTITPEPGQSRFDVFDQIWGEMLHRRPSLENATVLFFSLEPNTL